MLLARVGMLNLIMALVMKGVGGGDECRRVGAGSDVVVFLRLLEMAV